MEIINKIYLKNARNNYNKNSQLKKYLDSIWSKAFNKYKTFLNKKESSIQTSLFTDYFSQCVSVGNVGTDIMSGENSVEPRTPFIQKNIMEFALNLPLRHKIDFKTKERKLVNKPILKEIFIKYFGKKYINHLKKNVTKQNKK